MSIDSLKDLYTHELQDLYSANRQMIKVVRQMSEKAESDRLREMLDKSVRKIEEHNKLVAELVRDCGEDPSDEHCKGMEGLVKEARKHALEESYGDRALRDSAIIAQMQRMTHYGICGYGTAQALADALGKQDHVDKLETDLDEVYEADKYLSYIAEAAVNPQAAA
ncbi:MAG: ferritin-like domain-containing protein [Sphingomonadaceae bacterium]